MLVLGPEFPDAMKELAADLDAWEQTSRGVPCLNFGDSNTRYGAERDGH